MDNLVRDITVRDVLVRDILVRDILEGDNLMHNNTNIVQLSYRQGTFSFLDIGCSGILKGVIVKGTFFWREKRETKKFLDFFFTSVIRHLSLTITRNRNSKSFSHKS